MYVHYTVFCGIPRVHTLWVEARSGMDEHMCVITVTIVFIYYTHVI